MTELARHNLESAVRRIPKDLRRLMAAHAGKLYLGGGFIRAVVAGEPVSDIDLFGPSKRELELMAKELQIARGGPEKCRLHTTKNAITVISQGRVTIQFITRWVHQTPEEALASFDFTVCQAMVWMDPKSDLSPLWTSACAPEFYTDLASKRLRYTHPVRDEEAGGSLMRALKYQRRGYVLTIGTLAGVIARMMKKVRQSNQRQDSEESQAQVIMGVLREVDPLLVMDGMSITDDHEQKIQGL